MGLNGTWDRTRFGADKANRWRLFTPAIAILPQIDCVLLVAAVGLSKASEIEECNRHLQSSDIVRIVLNKATDAVPNYYY